MKTIALSHRAIAEFKNGNRVVYDRIEEHGEHRLFFRGSVGLVYSTTKDDIVTLEVKNDYGSNADNPTGGTDTKS